MATSNHTGFVAKDDSSVTIHELNQNLVTNNIIIPNEKTPVRMMELPTNDFIGRIKELSQIQNLFESFQENAQPLSRMIIITGSAGMGKSETAKKFAQTYKKYYPSVAFLNSETQESLNTSFYALAKELKIESANSQGGSSAELRSQEITTETIHEIYKELSRRDGDALFIFDNAVGLKSTKSYFGIEKHLPKQDYSKLPFFLLTSKHPDKWTNYQGALAKLYHLTFLRPDEMEAHLFHMFKPNYDTNCSDNVQKDVLTLASYIHGYPLALNLMKEFWDSALQATWNSRTLEERIQKILRKFQEGECKPQEDNKPILGDRLRVLSCLLETKMEPLSETDIGQVALEILGISAYLDPDFLYFDTCYRILESLPAFYRLETFQGGRKLGEIGGKFEEALWLLKKKDLIDVLLDANKIKVHRVIQELTRNRFQDLKSYAILEKVIKYSEVTWKWVSRIPFKNLMERKDNYGSYNVYLVRLCLATEKYRLNDQLVSDLLAYLEQANMKNSEEYRILKLCKLRHEINQSWFKKCLLRYTRVEFGMRNQINSLINSIGCINDIWIIRALLWILGEYSTPLNSIEGLALSSLKKLGALLEEDEVKEDILTAHILEILNYISRFMAWFKDKRVLVALIVQIMLNCYPTNIECFRRYWRLMGLLCNFRALVVSDSLLGERALKYIEASVGHLTSLMDDLYTWDGDILCCTFYLTRVIRHIHSAGVFNDFPRSFKPFCVALLKRVSIKDREEMKPCCTNTVAQDVQVLMELLDKNSVDEMIRGLKALMSKNEDTG